MGRKGQRKSGTKDRAAGARATIPFIQINLHHCKSASAVLAKSLAKMQTGIALIQEPWIIASGAISGLGGCGKLYSGSGPSNRTCIVLRGLQGEAWPKHCHQDLTTVLVKVKLEGGAEMVLAIASAYFPSDSEESPPPAEVRALIEDCKSRNRELILGCDANAHHLVWGSTNCNNRGEDLLEYVASTELDFLNKGSVPTFRNAVREEVLDITLASRGVFHRVAGWRVSEEVSMSDHETILFELRDAKGETLQWRNPRRTDWALYHSRLANRLPVTVENPQSKEEIEAYYSDVQKAILGAFEDSCRLVVKKDGKGAPWWNSKLESQRRELRKLLRKWRKHKDASSKVAFLDAQRRYKKALETAKRDGWKRYCDELDSIPAVARLGRILAKPTGEASGRIKLSTGGWAADSKEALDCLLEAHFPGLEMAESVEPSPATEYSEQEWETVIKVITEEKVRWAINSFEPFKAPGADGIFPALLQRGIDLLVVPLTRIYRACLSKGYMISDWTKAKIIFLPKPGKLVHEGPKDYRPISLTSFPFKTLERLVDRFIKDESLRDNPLHSTQHAYREGKSVDSALEEAVSRIKKGMRNRGMVLGAFLDVEGAFNYTTYSSVCHGARKHGIPGFLIRWIHSSLVSRIIEAKWGSATGRGRARRGCPQGGVLSPTLWSLVVDELLKWLNDKGIYAQAYADDILILIMGDDEATLAGVMRYALSIVEEWCKGVELSVNPRKTVLVNFTNKYKVKQIGPIRLFGEELSLSGEAKYLGVTLDSRLNWGCHLQSKRNNFLATFWTCRRAFGSTWGLKPQMLRWIYTAVLRPRILHGAIAWWPRSLLKSGAAVLDKLQALIMRGIAGVRRSTPLRALEIMLDLPPLELVIRAAALKAKLRVTGHCSGHEDTALIGALGLEQGMVMDKIPKKFFFEKNFKVILPLRSEEKPSSDKQNDMFCWYTDGSKDSNGTGAGAWLQGCRKEIVLSLEDHSTVFQAEIIAIRSCVERMLEEEWLNRKVIIYSDSRAALMSLDKVEVTSVEVRNCRTSLDRLAESCQVVLKWVPGHSGIRGNEKADRLAKRGAAGIRATKIAVATPDCCTEEKINKWLKQEHLRRWRTCEGCKHAKALVGSKPPSWTRGLIARSRIEIKLVVSWITGHCDLSYFRHRIGKAASSRCRLCEEEEETPAHLMCNCPRLVGRRRRECGEFILNTPDLRSFNLIKLIGLIKSIAGALQ